MNRIRVVVDGSAHADRALRHALKHALVLVKAGVTTDLDVLNVQTPIVYGEVLVYVGEERAKEHAMNAGEHRDILSNDHDRHARQVKNLAGDRSDQNSCQRS